MKRYPCHEAHFLLTLKKEPSAPKDQSKISGGPKKGIDSSLRFLTKFWSPPVIEMGLASYLQWWVVLLYVKKTLKSKVKRTL